MGGRQAPRARGGARSPGSGIGGALPAPARSRAGIVITSAGTAFSYVLAAPAGGRGIVRLRGALDAAAAQQLRERLIDVLHRGASPLIIDLSHVPSCDAAGLAVLIGTQRRAGLLGSVVLLAAPCPPVARLLRSSGLHRRFAIYPDVPGALAALRHEPAKRVIA